MDKKEKIYRRSGVAIACYVFAVILLIYTCYNAGTTVGQINEYYAGYGMSAKPMEYVVYVSQNSLAYLIYSVVVFMLGYILDAVRKTDPKNYMTEEEFADYKAAKKEAKEARKIAKGEKKSAAKAERMASEESSVAEDFANDLDKELKASEQKGEFKRSGGNKKYYGGNRNNNNNHRQSGNRNGGYRNNNGNGNGNGNRKNNNQSGNQNGGQNNQSNQNNQNKPKVEEKKAVEETKPVEQFEVKISED